MGKSKKTQEQKGNASAHPTVGEGGFEPNSDSDNAATATRCALIASYIRCLELPSGDHRHAHFFGAYVALWLIAMSEVGEEKAEVAMRGFFEWAQAHAFKLRAHESPEQIN